ncbi:MAG: hypothetical protein AAFO91_00490, partial [Bacteroidota bacterium]
MSYSQINVVGRVDSTYLETDPVSGELYFLVDFGIYDALDSNVTYRLDMGQMTEKEGRILQVTFIGLEILNKKLVETFDTTAINNWPEFFHDTRKGAPVTCSSYVVRTGGTFKLQIRDIGGEAFTAGNVNNGKAIVFEFTLTPLAETNNQLINSTNINNLGKRLRSSREREVDGDGILS